MTSFACYPADLDLFEDGPTSPPSVETATGWPRPRNDEGTPVPWVARRPDDLGHIDDDRRLSAIHDRLCQVCGEPLGEQAVVCARQGDEYVTDGAAIHPDRCWPLALRACPELVRLRDEGRLDVWTVDTTSLAPASTSPENPDAPASALLMGMLGLPVAYPTPDGLPDPDLGEIPHTDVLLDAADPVDPDRNPYPLLLDVPIPRDRNLDDPDLALYWHLLPTRLETDDLLYGLDQQDPTLPIFPAPPARNRTPSALVVPRETD